MSTRPALAPRPANGHSQSSQSSQRSASASAGIKRSREFDGPEDDERHNQTKRSRTDVFDTFGPVKEDLSSRQVVGLESSRVDDASRSVGNVVSPAALTNSATTKYAKSFADSILQTAFDAKRAKDKTRVDDLSRQAKEQEKSKSKADKEAAKMERERARLAKQQAEEEFRIKYKQAFPAWRFYFDGVSIEQRQTAGRKIESLGAVTEEFLSNKVTHFITPTKLEKENGNEKGKLSVPKGSLLKSPVDLKGAYNPLQKAKQWGCKIWDITKLESVLDRTLARPKAETPVTLQDIFTPAHPQPSTFITPSLNGSAQSGTSHAQSSVVFKQPVVQSTSLKPSAQLQPPSTSLKVPSSMINPAMQIFSRPKGPLNPYGALPEQKRSFTVPIMFTPRPGTMARGPSHIDPLQLQRMRKLNDPSKALAGLLATEKATNMTMERDPYSKRHDWSYFAKGTAFVIVESLSSAWGLVGKLEWKAHFITGVK